MDPMQLKSIESRLKEVELKLGAILEALKLDCQYTPEKYTLVQPAEENE